MSVSTYPTTNYPSSHFVESAGCVIFHLPSARICLLKYLFRNHWVLPKGRRNLHEPRTTTALREVQEETGYACKLLPVIALTRCPPAVETGEYVPDVPRSDGEMTEPFMLVVRDTTSATSKKHDVFGSEKSVKLIWWYVAKYEGNIEHNTQDPAPKAEEQFGVEWFPYEDAVRQLNYESDRDVVRRAIDAVNTTFQAQFSKKQ